MIDEDNSGTADSDTSGLCRRAFLKYTGMLAAALGLESVVAACGDSSPSAPNEAQELQLKINGPTSLRVDDAGEADAVYTSESTPREVIESETWGIRRITEPAQTEFETFGQGQEAEYTFNGSTDPYSEPVDHEIRLTVNPREGMPEEAFHQTKVYPPPIPYSNLYFFRYYTDPYQVRLMRMNVANPRSATEVWGPDTDLNSQRVSVEPLEKRFVFSRFNGSRSDLYILNNYPPKSIELLASNGGILWMPAWNPKQDLIVFSDDSRIPNNAADELVLIKPDGSGMRYLASSPLDEDFYAFYPSWLPDGRRFIGGNTRWPGLGQLARRLALYELSGGTATREKLHTEQQIEEAFPDADLSSLNEGGGGIATSPDGELVAYSVVYTAQSANSSGVRTTPTQNLDALVKCAYLSPGGRQVLAKTLSAEPLNYRKIAIAKTDGSGIVKVIERETPSGGSTWSYDGKYVFYDTLAGPSGSEFEFHIIKHDLATGVETNLTTASNPGGGRVVDNSPAFYH